MGIREPLREMGCGLPHALEVMGERWSFLILRAAFNGLCHFEEFSQELGIARNILSNRLAKLVENGVLVRTPCEADRRKIEYRLTEKGLGLLPAMLALRQWGERYVEDITPNLVLVDCRDGQPVQPITIRAKDGRELSWHELGWQTPDKIGQPVDRHDGAYVKSGFPDEPEGSC
ncbi:winged helix-turn-helix transcriptional regulator [Aurantiacibacter odishensis]|uniref:winged helix-turn-helix transcriptional regulator n=1 Tax=Aurantiacibacter odishensis TaxID=1155476 RepID=UPI000E724869|nr:helix-turn-helix domain-containing protein [Aurantiacibacter odishensis]